MLFDPLRDFAEDVDLKVLEFQMAYPYQQHSPYEAYSNPASPWNVDQQHQQPPTPIQGGTPSNHSNLTISPPAYPQQLSPESPVSMLPAYVAPPTIHLEERVPPQPNQFRFESLGPSHFEQQHQRARSSSKPPARVTGGDELAASTSPSSGGAGPSRVPHGRAHVGAAHPYRRHPPTGAASPTSGVVSRTGQVAAGSRSVSAAPSSATRGERAGIETLAERNAPRPSRRVLEPLLAASKAAVPCPAMDIWRLETHSDSGEHSAQGAAGGEAGAPTTSPAADSPASTPAEPAAPTASTTTPSRPRRLLISTDLWLDSASNEVVAMLELPGVKKDAVRLHLATCPFTGVQVLIVLSQTRSSIPEGTLAANKERRTGPCLRVINVPPGTKKEDVVAKMEDGLLTIRVPGRTPTYQDHQNIDIN